MILTAQTVRFIGYAYPRYFWRGFFVRAQKSKLCCSLNVMP